MEIKLLVCLAIMFLGWHIYFYDFELFSLILLNAYMSTKVISLIWLLISQSKILTKFYEQVYKFWQSKIDFLLVSSMFITCVPVWYGMLCRCLPERRVPGLYFFYFYNSRSSEGSTPFKTGTEEKYSKCTSRPFGSGAKRRATLWFIHHITPNRELRSSPLGEHSLCTYIELDTIL